MQQEKEEKPPPETRCEKKKERTEAQEKEKKEEEWCKYYSPRNRLSAGVSRASPDEHVASYSVGVYRQRGSIHAWRRNNRPIMRGVKDASNVLGHNQNLKEAFLECLLDYRLCGRLLFHQWTIIGWLKCRLVHWLQCFTFLGSSLSWNGNLCKI